MSNSRAAEVQAGMTIADLLDAYLAERDASGRYQESLRRTVRRLASYGLKNVCQLSPEKVNLFLAAVPVGATTRHNYRRETLTLWRWAFEQGLTDVAPIRVRRIAPARRPVQAWSIQQVRGLLDAADRDQTFISSRLPWRRHHFLPAWILLAWDSGLRFGDVWAARHADVRNDCIAVVCSKTGRVETRRLSPACVRAIQSVPRSPDGTIFRWAIPRRRALRHWRDFLDGLGVHGSSKFLRRAGATQVAVEHGEQAASLFLGHSQANGHLARQHYIDATLALIPAAPRPLR